MGNTVVQQRMRIGFALLLLTAYPSRSFENSLYWASKP